jgi:cyclopropane-fatty-acyl-phospholipid synthase
MGSQLAQSDQHSRTDVHGIDRLWLKALLRLSRRIEVGQLQIRLPDGDSVTVTGRTEPQHRAVLHIHRARAARRLLVSGTIGFAEAYMDGDWDTPDLAGLIALALQNEAAVGPAVDGIAATRWLHRLRHLARRNSRRGSKRNIAYHYDLSNAFYTRWLDATITYSSALFRTADEDLEAAQLNKYRRLADVLELRPGQHVLEIGCGWGGFAIFAARNYDCRVTGLTVSREQWTYARERVERSGLANRIDIRLQDYRDVTGEFDRIASVEMFEAVGETYWPTFFDTVRARLRPGGIAGLQIILIAEERFARYRRNADFIQHYIFPGGMLPSPEAMRRQVTRAGLYLADRFGFGSSYARTLAAWQQRFQRAWPEIECAGFDRRFKRMWEYYLAYCEAGFRTGALDVAQFRLEKRGAAAPAT